MSVSSSSTSLDLLGVGDDQLRQPAGGDDVGALAELLVEAAQDRVDRAGVAEHDAGADRVDRVLADHAAGRREVDLRQPRAALGQRVQGDLDAGHQRAADVLAVVRDDVERGRGAEVHAHRGARRSARGSRPR